MRKRFSRADLHKFLKQDLDANDVVRNHAFSKVGKGGEVKGLSVARRRELAAKRKTITDYRRSKIGGLHERPFMPPLVQKKPQEDGEQIASDDFHTGNRPRGDIGKKGHADTKHIDRRHHFIEPPRRNFDKYS